MSKVPPPPSPPPPHQEGGADANDILWSPEDHNTEDMEEIADLLLHSASQATIGSAPLTSPPELLHSSHFDDPQDLTDNEEDEDREEDGYDDGDGGGDGGGERGVDDEDEGGEGGGGEEREGKGRNDGHA
mmetsp:Transcript_32604/g.63848  ORF Transcript_32604/g.63848 Transcript_32604/m.63848 type:complete len:130 (+) Transcript_32604:1180-1569(+)